MERKEKKNIVVLGHRLRFKAVEDEEAKRSEGKPGNCEQVKCRNKGQSESKKMAMNF